MSNEYVVNYDEACVPAYTLPALLVMQDGTPVEDPAQWPARRKEILDLYKEQIFGHAPEFDPAHCTMSFELLESGSALDGRAQRKQIAVHLKTEAATLRFVILLYVPQGLAAAPAFVNLNFHGNHTIHDDPAILITDAWVREADCSEGNQASEKGRGFSASRYALDDIIARGYALLTVYYGDLDPDFDDGAQNGLHGLFPGAPATVAAEARWGSIAAWSWGLRRVMDYCETDEQIDHQRVAVMGHSRLGKTALWTAALDERFALVISNNSGCGGAALSRRCYGETIGIINRQFTHWFCKNHRHYDENESALPLDQHMLIALQAPRPVYVASAVEDRWADPKGEFLSTYHAGELYQLLGKQALPQSEQPALNQPLQTDMAYHIRDGVHDVTSFDWHAFLDFADKHFT